jgi:hypothetical protein
MRRTASGGLYALALFFHASPASSQTYTPYFEYEVRIKDYPVQYFTNVNEAAGDVVSKECSIGGFTNCKMSRVGYFNSIYFVAALTATELLEAYDCE